jgi:hypothetical protein
MWQNRKFGRHFKVIRNAARVLVLCLPPAFATFAGLQIAVPSCIPRRTGSRRCLGDTSLSRDNNNKTIFSGLIEITANSNVFQTCWANLIKAAKTALPCWNVDTQVIWDRFLAFNRARGNGRVPAGFLLGFMRRWRTAPETAPRSEPTPAPKRVVDPNERELLDQIQAAPSANRQFHASDLCRVIGQAAYDARVFEVIRQFGCPRFTATLAVHGRAVLAGEIPR